MVISGAGSTVGAMLGGASTVGVGSLADGDFVVDVGGVVSRLGLGRGRGRRRSGSAVEAMAVSSAPESGTAGVIAGAEVGAARSVFGIEPVDTEALSASKMSIASIRNGQLLLGKELDNTDLVNPWAIPSETGTQTSTRYAVRYLQTVRLGSHPNVQAVSP